MRGWGVSVVLVLAACGGEPAKRLCEVDRNCPSGQQCVAGACEPIDAGGGGSTDCASGCEAWQTCQPGNGGTCRDLTVTIDSPLDGAEFGAGAQVRVVARVTEWDGGVWQGASIPASATGGATAPANLMRTGNSFEGNFGLPMTGGMQTLTAGWPAANDVVAVLVRTCAVTCQPWQECRPSADGGSCDDLGLQLAWTRPTAGEQFGPAASASIPLELSVTRADGGAFGGAVPFILVGRTSGLLMPSGTSWLGSVDAGVQDGMRTIIAGWDAGPAPATRNFAIVATPPTVEVFAQAAPVRPADDTDADGVARWKKYELVPIQVESNRPLEVIAPSNFSNPGVTSSTRCTRMCAMGKSCQCFEVDLAQQVLTPAAGELAGTVTVTLNSASDVYGNTASAIAPVQVAVTRFKWKRQLASVVATPLAVAIHADGTIYAGAKTGAGGTELLAVRPDGGMATVFSSTTWAVTAGPMLGGLGDVYVAESDGANAKLVKNPGSTAVDRCLNNAGTFDGDLALATPGASEVAVAVRSDSFVAPGTASCAAAVVAPAITGRPSVVVSGTTAFLVGGGGAPIWKYTAANTIPVTAGSTSTGTLYPANLFVVGANIVGGGGGGPTTGGVFAFLDGVTLPASTTNATPGGAAGGPAVVGGTTGSPTVYYGDNAQQVRALAMSSVPGFPSAPVASPVLGTSQTQFGSFAPVVGKGGKVYVVGRDGVVRGLNASTLAEEWSWGAGVLPTNGAVSQLNLDINRDVGQPCGPGQPGVLYVAATRSNTTTLYAVLVDSAGLDRNAPWPRHQHDPANSGNPAMPLTSWTCP